MFLQGHCHRSCHQNTFLTMGSNGQLLKHKMEMVLFLFRKLLVSRELINMKNRLLFLEFKTNHELIYHFLSLLQSARVLREASFSVPTSVWVRGGWAEGTVCSRRLGGPALHSLSVGSRCLFWQLQQLDGGGRCCPPITSS